MCKDELVYAMASEDMDSLTFGTPRLTRNLMKPANAKVAVNEYDYQKVRLASRTRRYSSATICCSHDGHARQARSDALVYRGAHPLPGIAQRSPSNRTVVL